MIYQNVGTQSGGLLRMLLEEKSRGIAGMSPASEVGSPMRSMIQGPIEAPESPGTSRIVSLRPEGVTAEQGPQSTPGVVGPVAPVTRQPQAPVGPVSQGQGENRQTSGGGMPSSSMSASPVFSMPKIGTSIMPYSTGSVKGVSSGGGVGSSKSSYGVSPVTKYSQTQSYKPTTFNEQPSTSKAGGFSGAIGGTIQALGTKVLPFGLRALALPVGIVGTMIGSELQRQREGQENLRLAKQYKGGLIGPKQTYFQQGR